jgi:hypothetical protein
MYETVVKIDQIIVKIFHMTVKVPEWVLCTFTFPASPLRCKRTISFSVASRDVAKTPDRRGHFFDLRPRPTRMILQKMADQEFNKRPIIPLSREKFSQTFDNFHNLPSNTVTTANKFQEFFQFPILISIPKTCINSITNAHNCFNLREIRASSIFSNEKETNAALGSRNIL